jgi:PleD family two-component response regulator
MIHTASTTTNAVFIELLGHQKDVVKVLILGNNPAELATIYNNLRESRDKYYIVDVCFNLRDGLNNIIKNKPDVLLLDDNMDYDGTRKLVREIKRHAKIRDTQIILVKSSNWNYNVIDDVEDYLLKESINSEILDTTISNNIYRHKHQAA